MLQQWLPNLGSIKFYIIKSNLKKNCNFPHLAEISLFAAVEYIRYVNDVNDLDVALQYRVSVQFSQWHVLEPNDWNQCFSFFLLTPVIGMWPGCADSSHFGTHSSHQLQVQTASFFRLMFDQLNQKSCFLMTDRCKAQNRVAAKALGNFISHRMKLLAKS